MSHELTAERVPHCHHFQKGVCTKEDCPYVHVRVSPTALVCQNFPVYGYCEKGVNCTEKHIIECPDFSNTGSCTDRRCKLPHKYKAHHLRNNADSKQEDSDISSDEDEDPIDSDEVDSDDMEEYFASADGPEDMDFAEQKDFIEMQEGLVYAIPCLRLQHSVSLFVLHRMAFMVLDGDTLPDYVE